jgi:hypothetical protein
MRCKTLNEQYPQAAEFLIEHDCPALASLLSQFGRAVDLDKAIGTNGAVSKWVTRAHQPSPRMELRAQRLIRQGTHALEYSGAGDTAPPSLEYGGGGDTAPPAALTQSDKAMFMVVCPAINSSKVQKVLAMLSCEVVEIE